MTDHSRLPGWIRCALVGLLLLTCVPKADAAFTVSINGTQVVTDNSVGDHDIAAGVIRYAGTIDGYDIRLTTSLATLGSSSTLTELRVRNLAGDKTGDPLV